MSTKKKLLIFAGIIIGAFLILNGIWFFGIRIKYIKYLDAVDKIVYNDRITYGKNVEGMYAYVKPVGYLSYESGFLRISDSESIEVYLDDDGNEIIKEDEKPDISFYIWPGFGNKYDIGVMVYDERVNYQIIFDNDFNILYCDDEELMVKEQEYLDKYKEDIIDKMQVAERLWGFDF